MIFKGLYEEKAQEEEWYVETFIYGTILYARAVDDRGAYIKPLFTMDMTTGVLRRQKHVSKELGFDLDDQGRIKVKE